jgi:hypothetical protein
VRHDMWVGQQLGACAELRAWCLRLHPSSPVRVGNVRLGLIPPGWWASLHGRGTLLTVSGALVVHGTCAQPLESDVQSTNAGGSGHHPVEDTCHSIPLRAPGSSSPSTGGVKEGGRRSLPSMCVGLQGPASLYARQQ